MNETYLKNIGGWGGSPTGKSFRFVRACDAKLCVPVRQCCSQRWAAQARGVLPARAHVPSPPLVWAMTVKWEEKWCCELMEHPGCLLDAFWCVLVCCGRVFALIYVFL